VAEGDFYRPRYCHGSRHSSRCSSCDVVFTGLDTCGTGVSPFWNPCLEAVGIRAIGNLDRDLEYHQRRHIAVLLASLGLVIIRPTAKPDLKFIHTPLDWPLSLFFALSLFSTGIAIFQSSVDLDAAKWGLRVVFYYFTFFIVTNLVRERRQLNFLLNGIFCLATFVAAAMVVQFLVGEAVHLTPGRVESLYTRGTAFKHVTRVLPPGISVIIVSFMPILCILVLENSQRLKLLKVFQWGLLGMGLLITFLRSYWAVLILAVLCQVRLFRAANRRRFVRWGFVVVSSTAMILFILYYFSDPNSRVSRLVDASTDRILTLVTYDTFEGGDDSVTWRRIENGYAVSAIVSHPLIGLGIGARYRPWDPRLDDVRALHDGRKFLHNGHLWVMLQSGLLGYLSLMWLSLAFLMRGFRYWRSIANERMRGVVLGFTLAYLAILIAAVVNSTFTEWNWTPLIGIMMGINEVILSKIGQTVQ
jgi:hypothetical protein